MIGKKLINTGGAEAAFLPSQHFDTVTYTGNGGTQRIGGYINRGAVFNGSSSFIDTNYTLPSDSTMSFSFWVNVASLGSSDTYIMSDLSSSATDRRLDFRFKGSTGGQLYIDVGNGSSNYTTGNTSFVPTLNTWHHIVVTLNGTAINVYVDNGSPISLTSSVAFGTAGARSLSLGRAGDYTGTAHLNGKLDQVRIFDKALSSGEVTTLYGETATSTSKSVTDIFNDDSGVALYQLDGNANDTGRGAIDSGQSAVFNGSGSKIDLPVLGLGGASTRSMSAWIKTTNNGTTQFIFGSGTQAPYQVFAVHLSPTGKVSVSYSSSQLDTVSSPINNNQWHHIAVTFSGGSTNNTVLYVDGVSQTLTEIGTSGTVNTGNQNYAIGYNSPNPSVPFYFNGKIDDVRIYSDVLTSTEVGYIYNKTIASIPTDYVAYYKLNGNANDETTNYNGTETSITYSNPADLPTYNGTPTNVTYQKATDFQPDLVWIKNRSAAYNHAIYDSIRGAEAPLFPNTTSAQDSDVGDTYGLKSFNSNGFTLGYNGAITNTSGNNFVAWCWKAGGSAVSNTDGNVTTTVSANVEAGFSIVKYFGGNISNTYGHGLDSAPELIIIKNLDIVRDWSVVGTGLGGDGGDRLVLNDTVGKITTTGLSGTTATTFAFEHDNSIANSANNFIAYCFHSVDSYQKVGSYTGDNSTSGNIITTGFQPRFLMTKRIDTNGYNWYMWDSVRSPTNPRDKVFYADGAGAEYDFSAYPHNFLSNGFEVATNNAAFNALNGTYIYLAIA